MAAAAAAAEGERRKVAAAAAKASLAGALAALARALLALPGAPSGTGPERSFAAQVWPGAGRLVAALEGAAPGHDELRAAARALAARDRVDAPPEPACPRLARLLAVLKVLGRVARLTVAARAPGSFETLELSAGGCAPPRVALSGLQRARAGVTVSVEGLLRALPVRQHAAAHSAEKAAALVRALFEVHLEHPAARVRLEDKEAGAARLLLDVGGGGGEGPPGLLPGLPPGLPGAVRAAFGVEPGDLRRVAFACGPGLACEGVASALDARACCAVPAHFWTVDGVAFRDPELSARLSALFARRRGLRAALRTGGSQRRGEHGTGTAAAVGLGAPGADPHRHPLVVLRLTTRGGDGAAAAARCYRLFSGEHGLECAWDVPGVGGAAAVRAGLLRRLGEAWHVPGADAAQERLPDPEPGAPPGAPLPPGRRRPRKPPPAAAAPGGRAALPFPVVKPRGGGGGGGGAAAEPGPGSAASAGLRGARLLRPAMEPPIAAAAALAAAPAVADLDLGRARAVGQVDAKFVAAVCGGAVVVFDQHASDERVVLERLKARLDRAPETVLHAAPRDPPLPLPALPAEVELLASYAAQIEAWGWRLRVEGTEAWLAAEPVVFGKALTVGDLQEFAHELHRTHGSLATPPAVQRLLNSKACRSSIMFGQVLAPARCQRLVDELARCRLRLVCAHGRPTAAAVADLGRLDLATRAAGAEAAGKRRRITRASAEDRLARSVRRR